MLDRSRFVIPPGAYVHDPYPEKWGMELTPSPKPQRQGGDEKPKKIKSDGGSSAYYDLPLSDKLVELILQRKEEGSAFIKTEEIILEVFDNDFDAANSFKSLVRAWQTTKGGGKEGNTLSYELNKIRYSLNKIEERFKEEK